MDTIDNLKQKLVALGMAATAALLLLGAGTAHADPYPKTFDNGKIRVDYTSSPLGLTATIQDHTNTGLGTENCNYQAFSSPMRGIHLTLRPSIMCRLSVRTVSAHLHRVNGESQRSVQPTTLGGTAGPHSWRRSRLPRLPGSLPRHSDIAGFRGTHAVG